MKVAVVIGSTGLIGQQLVQKLAQDSNWTAVLAITRSGLSLSHPKVRPIRFDFENWGDLEMQIRSFTGNHSLDAFCCLGTTIKKAGSQAAFKKVDLEAVVLFSKLVSRLNAESLIVVSAMGADANSQIFYNQVKGEMETTVEKEFKGRHLSFLRPSLLLGDRHEFRFGERVAILLAPLYSWMFGGPLKKYKPIQSSQVADVMVKLASKQKPFSKIIENDSLLNDF